MSFGDPRTLALLAIVAVVGVSLLIASVRSLRASAGIIAGMIFFAALATQGSLKGAAENYTWLRPLQVGRAELYLSWGVLLALVALVHAGKLSFASMSSQGLILLAINLYAGMLDMIHATPLDGVARIVFASVTMIAIMLVAGGVLREWDDWLHLVRALGFCGAAWAGAGFVQLMIDPSQMLVNFGRRFTGMLGNPQATAVYLGPMAAIITWLAFNEPVRRLRWFWIGAAALNVVLLGWTGSRTGALLYLLGLSAILYTRIGRATLLLPVAGAALWGLIGLVEAMGIEIGFGRLTSGLDTRSDAWRILMEDALTAPMFGGGGGSARMVENSFLLGTVVYGPAMTLLMGSLILTNAIQCVRLWRCRAQVPPLQQRLIDLTIAYNGMYFIGANFEWYICARLDANIVYLLVFGAICTRTLQKCRSQPVWENPDADEQSHADYGEEHAGVGRA